MTTQTRTVSLVERQAAYDHVFGNVNVKATKRLAPEDPKAQEMRVGKTKADKAKGHVAGVKNIRFPVKSAPTKKR